MVDARLGNSVARYRPVAMRTHHAYMSCQGSVGSFCNLSVIQHQLSQIQEFLQFLHTVEVSSVLSIAKNTLLAACRNYEQTWQEPAKEESANQVPDGSVPVGMDDVPDKTIPRFPVMPKIDLHSFACAVYILEHDLPLSALGEWYYA